MTTLIARHPLLEIARDIKLAHSVFALPFALLAACMAAAGVGLIDWRRFAGQLVLIVLAMFLARTVAMLANRILDRHIDARNQRTADRAIPGGRLRTSQAVSVAGVSALGFVVVCSGFLVFYGNPWPLALSIPVLIWISAYALLKRRTSLCHLYLGSSLALSPLAAALAIAPTALLTQPAIWLLSVMVLGWVAGFDIVYALQDVAVDRRDGLFSIPARLGERRGLLVSRLLHGVAVGALVLMPIVDARLNVLFSAAVCVIVMLLVYEHVTVQRWGTKRIAVAFFLINGIISCVLGASGIVDVFLSMPTG